MYIQPDIYSSYKENDLGQVLYDTVIKYKPKKIVEFGCLYGYSTISMAQAIRDLDMGGEIIAYDLWDKYQYRHTQMQVTQKSIDDYKLTEYVKLRDCDYEKWLDNPEPFDLLHLDIGSTGDLIFKTFFKLQEYIQAGSIIVFEGGTIERDNVEWMSKYNKIPIYQFKSVIKYDILSSKFPSISIIKK